MQKSEKKFPIDKVQNMEKMIKTDLRIISKSHACLEIMTKTPVQFKKKKKRLRVKLNGVADTRYPLPIYFGS